MSSDKKLTKNAIFTILLIAVVLSMLGTFVILDGADAPTAKVVDDLEEKPLEKTSINIYIERNEEEEEKEVINDGGSIE